MELTLKTCLEVASHEALIRQTYVDSVGVKTWCVGMTDATGHTVDRYVNKPAPLQHCMNLFVWALDNYADHVRDVFQGYNLTGAQFTAALSFTWNLGAKNLRNATWVERWKAGDVEGAREAFMWFNKPAEIIDRRKKERDLFFDGKWSNNGTMLEFTRVTSKMRPDWRSGKRINVTAELSAALAGRAGVTLDAPAQPQVVHVAPTMSEVATPRPKPAMKSTTNWTAIGGFFTSAVAALGNMDPYIAVPVILVAGGLAFWIIRERLRHGSEMGI